MKSLLNKMKSASRIGAVTVLGATSLVGCGPEKPNLKDYENVRFIHLDRTNQVIDYNMDGNVDAFGHQEGNIIEFFVEGERDSLKKYFPFRSNASAMSPEMQETANDFAESKQRLNYLIDQRRYELSQER